MSPERAGDEDTIFKAYAIDKVPLDELRILTNPQEKEQGEKEEGQKPSLRIKNDKQIMAKEIYAKYKLSMRYAKKFMLNHKHMHGHRQKYSHKNR